MGASLNENRLSAIRQPVNILAKLFCRKYVMHVGIEQEGCGAEEGVCQPAQLPRHLRLHLPHLPHAAVLPAHPL